MSASVCGLDVHKDSTYATILYCDGRIVSQRRMVNDKVLPYLSAYQISRIKIKEMTPQVGRHTVGMAKFISRQEIMLDVMFITPR